MKDAEITYFSYILLLNSSQQFSIQIREEREHRTK